MNNIKFQGSKKEIDYYNVYQQERLAMAANRAFEERSDIPMQISFNHDVEDAVISDYERMKMLNEVKEDAKGDVTRIAMQRYKEQFPVADIKLVKSLMHNDPNVLAKLGLDENKLSNQRLIELNQTSINKQYQRQQNGFVADLVNSGDYKPVTGTTIYR